MCVKQEEEEGGKQNTAFFHHLKRGDKERITLDQAHTTHTKEQIRCKQKPPTSSEDESEVFFLSSVISFPSFSFLPCGPRRLFSASFLTQMGSPSRLFYRHTKQRKRDRKGTTTKARTPPSLPPSLPASLSPPLRWVVGWMEEKPQQIHAIPSDAPPWKCAAAAARLPSLPLLKYTLPHYPHLPV